MLDVVFLEEVTDVSHGDQAAVIIIIFLLWRILRIVNGQISYIRRAYMLSRPGQGYTACTIRWYRL